MQTISSFTVATMFKLFLKSKTIRLSIAYFYLSVLLQTSTYFASHYMNMNDFWKSI